MALGTSDATISIAIKLLDEASVELKKSLKEIGTEADRLKGKSVDAGNTIQDEFKKAGKELKEFRRTVFFVTAAFAAIVASVNEASKYNEEAKRTMDEFKKATSALASELGVILVPAVKGVTEVVGILTTSMEAATAGFVKAFAFMAEIVSSGSWNPLKAGEDFKRAMDVANRAADEFITKQVNLRQTIQQGLPTEETTRTANKIIEDINRIEQIVSGKVIPNIKRQLTDFQKVAQGVVNSVTAGFATAFGNIILEGQSFGDAMKSLFKDIVRTILAELAKIAAIKLFTKLFGFHEGGEVEKFHSGGVIRAHDGLAVDEVPIIAQTGEGILSRKGMRALGGNEELNRLNSGQSSGNTISVNINGPVIRDTLDIRVLADMLGLEIERGLRYART